jgi:phosphoribosylamine--glycine ligase
VRVLVVGGGGREHALAWRLASSPSVTSVLAAPGNPGIEEVAELVPVQPTDIEGLARVAADRCVDLTVVGPEAPLVGGLVDGFERRGLPAFGPSAAAARLEGSKAFGKLICERYGIPAARSESCRDDASADAALERLGDGPYVVKADGLAAGKGVTVTDSLGEARRAVRAALVERAFGDAGSTVVIEEYLEGAEVSALALSDGRAVGPLAFAQDFKRALDGDAGPNTGGMGAYSPVTWVDAAATEDIHDRILRPAVAAMAREDTPYRGVLYAGLMITADGPKVIEFNCRFGDPESQVLLPRLASDLAEALRSCVEGSLDPDALTWSDDACVGVVLASGGYPGHHETGFQIDGLAEASREPGVHVFHGGTERRAGRVVTAGGRVLTVSALAGDADSARERAYRASSAIRFQGKAFRTDIAATAGASHGTVRA